MKSWNTPIPKGKLGQFDQLLKKVGGRYLSNPRKNPGKWGEYRVDFELETGESQDRFYSAWSRLNREIVETRKDQKWRIILRRIWGTFRPRKS